MMRHDKYWKGACRMIYPLSLFPERICPLSSVCVPPVSLLPPHSPCSAVCLALWLRRRRRCNEQLKPRGSGIHHVVRRSQLL